MSLVDEAVLPLYAEMCSETREESKLVNISICSDCMPRRICKSQGRKPMCERIRRERTIGHKISIVNEMCLSISIYQGPR